MKTLALIVFLTLSLPSFGQTSSANDALITNVLADPTPKEISDVITGLRQMDLSPKDVTIKDSITLANNNKLFVMAHNVNGLVHYGAVIVPPNTSHRKLPVILFATGGDGIHKDFDITQDFNHAAAQFPSFLGTALDKKFIVVVPSFRGQRLIIGDKTFQSEGDVSDAFGGAATDALAFLNVVLKTIRFADDKRIAVYGGSRGGTVALLAAARDKRIKRAIVVAAPSDMRALYQLYPEQFKILFFNDLLSGKITERAARKNFIEISPLYFTRELPPIQLHHDKNDPFVPSALAEKLLDQMTANGQPVEAHFYDEGIHGFWADKRYWERVQIFLEPLLK